MTNIDEIPRGVSFLQDALAERLGRPAAIRAPKNDSSQWYLFDPCFSAIQRGMGSSSRDYRSGIHIMDGKIRFYNVHSRSSAKLLRANLLQRPEALLNAAEKTLHLRSHHLLYFSSRSKSKKAVGRRWEDTVRFIESPVWKEFKVELERNPRGLVLDMFPELPSAGKIGTGEAVRGSDFCLLLADYHRIEYAKSDESAAARASQVVDAAWYLFACFYPWDSPKRRDASLRRAMLSKPGLLECEYSKIESVSHCECDGSEVQAAHIVPHGQGGSDRYWNGMWLCAKHHRMTEGRLAGSRSRSNPDDLQVRLIAPLNDL